MKATVKNIQAVRNEVNNVKTRSAWSRGVQAYALDMLDSFEEWREWAEKSGKPALEFDEQTALNGAEDWSAWSSGGCGLVYNSVIAERLSTPSEFKKVQGGAKQPNSRETWIQVEARAAFQAWRMIAAAVRKLEA